MGSILNAFGVAFITKGALGTSQISSISYVMSLQFTNVSFGTWTFLLNMIVIALQILLLKKDFKPVELLQIVANLLFSWFIDLGMLLFGFLNPISFPARLLSLLVGRLVNFFNKHLTFLDKIRALAA